MTPRHSVHDAATTQAHAAQIIDGMTLHEQIGLLLHPIVILEDHAGPDTSVGFGGPTFRELIGERGIRFFALGRTPDPVGTARALERLQAFARSTGSRLPIVFSTDPRHSFMQNDAAAHQATGVSQWPENLGLGAIGDVDLVRRFAAIVRKDYLAMGIRMALHPQVDLATEPRWARQAQSFGSEPGATTRLLTAFLEGLQGRELGPTSIAATVKHFPGGGPQLNGDDPHFPYGREQVYPGGRFQEHLAPFRAAIAAGVAAIMPYYGMPVGLALDGEPVEEVGFAFNKLIITELLRKELGYDGVVLSDFGLVTDVEVMGKPFPACAWGVEHLSPVERVARLLDAGVDQLGGENDAALLTEAVSTGLVSADRIRESAVRLVSLMVGLGILDEDPAPSPLIDSVRAADELRLGEIAQARAITVLTNGAVGDSPVLPITGAPRVHLRNLAESALPDGWETAQADDADLAIVRLAAPYEPRDEYFLEAGMQQGSLEFPPGQVADLVALARRVPVVLVVTMYRPAILTPLVDEVAAIVADFGASDQAVLDALTGGVPPEGRLPFEIPRSMTAVEHSRPDVPNDTVDPLFPAGWGRSIGERGAGCCTR